MKPMTALLAAALLLALVLVGMAAAPQAEAVDFTQKNMPPCPQEWFGTDSMGRSVLLRTLAGLSLSIRIGVLAALVSALAASAVGTLCAIGPRAVDEALQTLMNLLSGIPHILLLIVLSCAAGRGLAGVVLSIAATHWVTPARILRIEVREVMQRGYVQAARRFGASRMGIVLRHVLPAVSAQLLTGLLLLFPHAILHESSLSFLGFGISAEQVTIGAMLAESLRYLAAGRWWTALLPGGALIVAALLFELLGKYAQAALRQEAA